MVDSYRNTKRGSFLKKMDFDINNNQKKRRTPSNILCVNQQQEKNDIKNYEKIKNTARKAFTLTASRKENRIFN